MIAVIQRAKEAAVKVDNQIVGQIKQGIVTLLGVEQTDTQKDAEYLVEKIIHLRIFEDEQNKMNRSLIDIQGQMLIVSQFTLLGDCRKGRRPSFSDAAAPEKANELYEYFVSQIKAKNIHTETGIFAAMMDVSLINDGPVTFIVQSKR